MTSMISCNQIKNKDIYHILHDLMEVQIKRKKAQYAMEVIIITSSIHGIGFNVSVTVG